MCSHCNTDQRWFDSFPSNYSTNQWLGLLLTWVWRAKILPISYPVRWLTLHTYTYIEWSLFIAMGGVVHFFSHLYIPFYFFFVCLCHYMFISDCVYAVPFSLLFLPTQKMKQTKIWNLLRLTTCLICFHYPKLFLAHISLCHLLPFHFGEWC